jgi:16S rRNA (uracil1498-N3)-methyltransferase
MRRKIRLIIFLLTRIEHESIPSSIAADISELQSIQVSGRIGEQQQASITQRQQKRGRKLRPLFCLRRARKADNNSSMTRRRWIADTFTDDTASLIGPQAAHLARVLRAQPGMQADIVANGSVYHAAIASVSREEVIFTLMEKIDAEAALPITLLLSVFRFDRMEWAIEKATELGVASVVPILARRTEKHLAEAAGKRVERWRRLAHEAAKQSRRADLPVIEDPIALTARLQQPSTAQQILLAEDERLTTLRQRIEVDLTSVESDLPNFELAIGPEGGWTPEELALFAKHNWQRASLGPRILRAETAAIAAIAITSSMLS